MCYMTKVDNMKIQEEINYLFSNQDSMIDEEKQYIHQVKLYYLPFELNICLNIKWMWSKILRCHFIGDLGKMQRLFYKKKVIKKYWFWMLLLTIIKPVRNHKTNFLISLVEKFTTNFSK